MKKLNLSVDGWGMFMSGILLSFKNELYMQVVAFVMVLCSLFLVVKWFCMEDDK